MTIAVEGPNPELVDLHEALACLAEEDPVKEQVVELRFFGGLSGEETAEVLGVDRRTVDRYWQYSRAWLFRKLTEDDVG